MTDFHMPQNVEQPYLFKTSKTAQCHKACISSLSICKDQILMNNLPKHFTAVWLLSTLILCLQSCEDRGVQLEKSKVQFTLSPGNASNGKAKDINLPENTRLRISIESNSGTPIFSDHEVQVLKAGNGYLTDPLELVPGTYQITDFMIVNDGEVLYAAPKNKSQLSSFVQHSLHYNFSVTENSVANVSMQVIDARNEKPEAFGYASFKKVNSLSFIVFKKKGGQTSLRGATAELRQGKILIKTFSVNAGKNTIAFEGDPDALYTLSVYAGEEAKAITFNFRQLKKELGAKPLKIALEPALLLTMESGVDEGNEYEEFFEFILEGTGGAVNVNWGDGYESSATLPLNLTHEYTTGSYTAIVTGDLAQITNLYGFSYGTIIYAIKGLTNLTALKTYNPSWGAVPIKVDLSNCKKLETIYVAKYGAPYEPCDLRTDFKLPEEHFIKEFIFDAPTFDINREFISAAELAVLVDNIYNNAIKRDIHDGNFFVNPVEAPSAETQQKLDILQNDYNWGVGLNDQIYFESGRTKQDLKGRREKWLRNQFPNSVHLSRSSKMAVAN